MRSCFLKTFGFFKIKVNIDITRRRLWIINRWKLWVIILLCVALVNMPDGTHPLPSSLHNTFDTWRLWGRWLENECECAILQTTLFIRSGSIHTIRVCFRIITCFLLLVRIKLIRWVNRWTDYHLLSISFHIIWLIIFISRQRSKSLITLWY